MLVSFLGEENIDNGRKLPKNICRRILLWERYYHPSLLIDS